MNGPEKNEPPAEGFFAVIPGSVRYDKSLPASAKLLYGEIFALCSVKGYCWAGNAYLAERCDSSERSVSGWIKLLADRGHVSVSYTFVPGKKEIESRRIRLTDTFVPGGQRPDKRPAPPPAGGGPPPSPNAPPPKNSYTPVDMKISSPPGEEIFTTYGKNFPGVVQKFSGGGEEIFQDINTSNITKETAAAPEDAAPGGDEAAAAAPQKTGPGIPEGGGAAPESLGPEEVARALAAADPRLVFDAPFLRRAAAWLNSRGLDGGYLLWLREFCAAKRPRSLTGLFYRLFFLDQMAALFAEGRREAEEERAARERREAPVPCPACGEPFGGGAEHCPRCGLARDAPGDEAEAHRRFLLLPEGEKDRFHRERDAVLSGPLPFPEKARRLGLLHKSFGLP